MRTELVPHGMRMKKFRFIALIVIVIMALSSCELFAEKSRYPLKYNDLINKYAQEYELDPYLIAAIINTESGFDETAVSKAGAMGLMQLMPTTAQWISEKEDINDEDFVDDDLFDPETNIKYGCWYLRFIKERFDKDVNILAAYNAGHSRVAEWLENSEYSADGELTNIPYEETKNYVTKVKKAYDKYKELYEEI